MINLDQAEQVGKIIASNLLAANRTLEKIHPGCRSNTVSNFYDSPIPLRNTVSVRIFGKHPKYDVFIHWNDTEVAKYIHHADVPEELEGSELS